MIITMYVVAILSPFVFETIEWFVGVVGALCTNEFNDSVVESLVASTDDVVWMIDGFVRDTEVESVGNIIGELEGADVGTAFNATEGIVAVVGFSVCSIVES